MVFIDGSIIQFSSKAGQISLDRAENRNQMIGAWAPTAGAFTLDLQVARSNPDWVQPQGY